MPKKSSNKPTRYVNFRTYKEPIRDDVFWGSGYSPIAFLIAVLVLCFLLFYILFGINDPIEIYDVLVDKVTEYAKMTSLLSDIWKGFTTTRSDTLEFNGVSYEIRKDWGKYFSNNRAAIREFLFGWLSPEGLGVS